MDELDRLLSQVKQRAGGMLALPVYRRLFETAAACGGTIVEIGTAQGAATIVLALGARQSGKPFRIVTADPFAIDSRRGVGSVADNVALVRRGFEAFGVADAIDSIVGTSAELAARIGPGEISLLMLDADGRIDRDLALLHARLGPACPIVIDDIDGEVYFHRSGGSLLVDQKHRLARLLAERFTAEGLLVAHGKTGQTGWYAKGPASLSPAEIERVGLSAYRQLSRAVIDMKGIGRAARRAAARRLPWLARAYRRVRPRSPQDP